MQNEHSIFIACECNTEGLLINENLDTIEYGSPFNSYQYQAFYISMYRLGLYNPKPTFWQRLKYAWYHIKTGRIYQDQIILNQDEALQVADFLNARIKANTKS